MAAGNDGANKPENDDPFGYLYADGQAAGAQPPQGGGYGYPGPAAAQPGVPRTSYNQVRTVGERQYGGPTQGHGQAYVPPQQQAPYGQPQAQYAAPETYGGPPRQSPPPQQQRGGSGRGPNTKGLLVGAVAVVAVVVIGIAAAVISNSGDKDDKGNQAGGGTTATAPAQVSEKPTPEPSADKTPAELPKQDAAILKLGGPASLDKTIKGAKGADGAYVSFNGVGGSASWSVDVPESGEYTLRITYSVPGKDAKTSLTVNSEQPRGLNMSNFAKAAEGDWEKSWTYTYAYVNLNKGTNALKISCEAGDTCEAVLDQVYLEAGHTGKG
ncbi:carbohydrate-binding protein [Streptomyces sp. CB02261]|uniref:carbohydrate-binding protein n=1 Tax=Streptomyces sp. CB02261 TaxID=1703940 RepID=UPI00093F633F|nr:carbohydrate-binding protein [Streptomyces sp. CB02261]OKJ49709.1 carbohydrate-binding protein [Streptomyces sp. CB02261]